MSIALFIESPNTDKSATNQTLVVPDNEQRTLSIYHRTSTGSRGRSESWKLTDLDELPQDQVIYAPIAVRLTRNDELAIRAGKVTQLAVKAQTASESATPVSLDPKRIHAELVTEIATRLGKGDGTLGEYLVDARITNKVLDLAPLTGNSETPVVPVAQSTERELVTVELASVPDIKWAKNYIHRKIAGGISEFAVFDSAIQNRENVLIKGHAGSGKTMSVLAYASERGHRYYNVSSHIGVEPSQLFGKWNPTSDGHFRWQDGAVTDLVRNGGVLLLNEVNFLPERVTTVLFSLLDDRREIQLMDKDGEVVKAHPDLLIVADMNPSYRGTRELNEAWNDRFHHHLEFPYDPEIEKKLIASSAIREMAGQLRGRFEDEELATPISTRSLVAFTRNITNLGLDYAISSYVNTFPLREQAPVRLVLDTYRTNIEIDLGIKTAPVVEDVVETIPVETAKTSEQALADALNQIATKHAWVNNNV